MRAHWKEYPVSTSGELAFALRGMLAGLGFGLAASLALIIGLMIPTELGLTRSVFLAVGFDAASADNLITAIEPIVRLVTVTILALAAAAMLGGGATSVMADVAVSNALTTAADDDAPRSAVPSPQQVQRIGREKPPSLDVTVGILAGVTGLAAIVLICIGLFSAFDEAVVAGVVALLVMAALFGLLRILRRKRRRLSEQRLEIAAHWTPEDEQAAWDAAREFADSRMSATLPARKREGRHPWVRIGFAIGRWAFAAIVVLPLAMMLLISQFFPNAHRYGRGAWEIGDPITIDSADVAAWGSAALLVLALFAFALLPLVGVGFEWAGVRAERRQLINALAEPDTEPPAASISAAHSERTLPESALLCGHIAGIMIGPALGVLIISIVEPGGYYEGPDAHVRSLVLPAAIAAIASAALLAAAMHLCARAGRDGLEMRNRLMERWPYLPRPETRSVGDATVPVRATVGPALTPADPHRSEADHPGPSTVSDVGH